MAWPLGAGTGGPKKFAHLAGRPAGGQQGARLGRNLGPGS
jgi:hypothetical protein